MNTTDHITLERYFESFKKDIVGDGTAFKTQYGKQKLLYADWVASGRLYRPIEDTITKTIGPMVANTHS
nr:selenocysteine lyase [Muricauda sp. AC10]